MTTGDLVSAVLPVAGCFDRLRVRWFVTGSTASSAHGIARASLDADLVAELEPVHVDPLIACLGDAGRHGAGQTAGTSGSGSGGMSWAC